MWHDFKVALLAGLTVGGFHEDKSDRHVEISKGHHRAIQRHRGRPARGTKDVKGKIEHTPLTQDACHHISPDMACMLRRLVER